jgi:DNA mismatch repair protein MutL
LRSETTELAHIATLATEYSLAHPDKNFTLIHDEKELLAVTPAADLRERVYQIFGGQLLEELIPLPPVERALPPEPGSDSPAGTLRLTGFVSRPQFQKSNRNSIHLFVNGRVIRDRLLLHALNSAYYNLVPSGVYPFALLFLSCDYEEVDVNVHPSKTEVRFRHGPVVHDFVRDAVRDALIAAKPAPSLPSSRVSQPAAHLPTPSSPNRSRSSGSQAYRRRPPRRTPSCQCSACTGRRPLRRASISARRRAYRANLCGLKHLRPGRPQLHRR